ncbi:MAG: amidohydrolase family protein, partial [Candidatus Limiplasma sp.]|nr:amidohydrolase family protein [Candidatus Limiplasma sp.]
MNGLLHGATVYHQGSLHKRDIAFWQGKIIDQSAWIRQGGYPAFPVIPSENCIVVPGFADVHVHLREPGFSYKETIRTGTLAAARGGYTTVCAMPNLNPAPDS